MNFKSYMEVRLPDIEETLQNVMNHIIPTEYPELSEMLSYHMGWIGEGAEPQVRGKRLRSLLVLLTTEACGGDWRKSLPAATSVGFLHNFSLIHDDIEDNSDIRRGRPTVWKNWGLPQALNSGDLMFSMAYASMMQLNEVGHSAEKTLTALNILQHTIQELIQGQHLDMVFETRREVSLDDYWQMINGKTAALLASCCQLGALTADAKEETQNHLADFGRSMGLAFQVIDDWLGIWGDPEKTGKEVGSDLISRKKTIPILYGLKNSINFRMQWQNEIDHNTISYLADLLSTCGAEAHTLAEANRLTEEALLSLDAAFPQSNPHVDILRELSNQMTSRTT